MNGNLMENNNVYQVSILLDTVRKTFVIFAMSLEEAVAKTKKYGSAPQIHAWSTPSRWAISTTEYWTLS